MWDKMMVVWAVTKDDGVIGLFRSKEDAEAFCQDRGEDVLPWTIAKETFEWEE